MKTMPSLSGSTNYTQIRISLMGIGSAAVIISALFKGQPNLAAACLAVFLFASTVAVIRHLVDEKRFLRPEQLVFLVGYPALGFASVMWTATGTSQTMFVVAPSAVGAATTIIALAGFLRRVRAGSPGAMVQTISFGLAIATIAAAIGAIPRTPHISLEAIIGLAAIGAITAHVKPSRTLVGLSACAIMSFVNELTLPTAEASSPLFVLLIFPGWVLFLAATDDSWARIGFKPVHFGKPKLRRTSRVITTIGMVVGMLHAYLNPAPAVFAMGLTLITLMAVRGFYYQSIVESNEAGIGEMHSCVASIMSAGSQRQISHQGAVWVNRFTSTGSVSAVIARSMKTDEYKVIERQGFWDPDGTGSVPLTTAEEPQWYCTENGPKVLDQIATGNRGDMISEPLMTGATDMWLVVVNPSGRQFDRSEVSAVESVVKIMNQAYSRLPETATTALDGVSSESIVALGISRMGPTRGTLEYISESSFKTLIGKPAEDHRGKTVRLLLHPDSFAEANNFIRSKGGDLGELVFMTASGPKWFDVETYRPVAADEDLIMWQLAALDKPFEPKSRAKNRASTPTIKATAEPEAAAARIPQSTPIESAI